MSDGLGAAGSPRLRNLDPSCHPTSAFGTLMCLEPAIAVTIGFLILHQVPGAWPVLGIGFVVAAGIGAERTGARQHLVAEPPAAEPDETARLRPR